ncbi:MAG: DPP IV N-terminal domain-containing protein, partial [Bacteroidales bacterium]
MALQPKKPKPVYIDGSRIFNLQISPDNRFVTFISSQSEGEDVPTEYMNYVTESGYAESEKARAKVGGPQSIFELHVIDTKKDSSYKVVADDIPGITEWPEYFKEYGKECSEPRKVSVFGTKWSDDGKYGLVEVRSLDSKDRWIMLLDPETGALELLDRQRDEAWIAGPGISGWGFYGILDWMPDNKHIWFVSEESGYAHIYQLNVETKEKIAITQGEFEVYDPFLSKDEKYWYYTSNEVHPGVRHFYRKPVNGGSAAQITSMEGNNDVKLSPDEKWLAIRYSYSN